MFQFTAIIRLEMLKRIIGLPQGADGDLAQSEYEKGQLICQQCGTSVSFVDEDTGEFTAKHWEGHREAWYVTPRLRGALET